MPRAVLHPHSSGGSEAEAPTNYPRLTRLGTTFVAAERSPRIAILVLTFRAMLDARRNKKSTRTRSDLRRGDLRTGKRCEQPASRPRSSWRPNRCTSSTHANGAVCPLPPII